MAQHFRGCFIILTVMTICLVNSCNAGKTTNGLYVHKEKDWIDRGLDIFHGKWDSSEKEVTVFGVTAGIGSVMVLYLVGEMLWGWGEWELA